MVQTILTLLLSLYTLGLQAQFFEVGTLPMRYQSYFAEAYEQQAHIPKGMLEAVAFSQSRLRHLQPDQEAPSCIGLPQYWGTMGLVADGKGYFRQNLQKVAELSGYTAEAIKQNPRLHILAFAKAYGELAAGLSPRDWKGQAAVLLQLSELPLPTGSTGASFAADSYLYVVLNTLRSPSFRKQLQLSPIQLDLTAVFGENLSILQAKALTFSGEEIRSETGALYQSKAQFPCADVSPAFPHSVLQVAADASNFSSRAGSAISHITIHTMQGSYAGSISWFQNPAANVSAHYNIRSIDGQITQMVCEADKAWHVASANPYTIGIEHEGFVDDPTWYTDVMYRASADLSKDIAQRYGILRLRTYDINGDVGLNPISDGCFKIKGHQHYANQSHTDPEQYWDWNRYYDLINPEGLVPSSTFTSCAGSFTDPGGATGNYANDERVLYKIAPVGATQINLDFSSLDLEAGYDFLYIYDGDGVDDSLIATIDGTIIPPTISAFSGKMLLEFRSDCGFTRAGWEAHWSCSNQPPSCGLPQALSALSLSPNSALLQWADVPGATAYQLQYKQSIQTNWTTATTTQSQYRLDALAVDGWYQWKVKAICANASSRPAGGSFIHQSSMQGAGSTACEGTWTDIGGRLGNYRNNEDYWFTIAPPGAASVELSFSDFDLESGYDYMYFYDGMDGTAPQIGGAYSGSSLPPNIVASSGSLTIHFSSDGWISKGGWEASWTCQGSPAVAVQEQALESLKVFPNPAKGQVTFLWENAPAGELQLQLFDALGQQLTSRQYAHAGGAWQRTLDLEGLPKGWYFYRITQGKERQSGKLQVLGE